MHNGTPLKWIYTDIQRRIQVKNLSDIKTEDVIKAFLFNVDKTPVTDETLINLFGIQQGGICFGIYKDTRKLLDLAALSSLNIKNLDALQLYKIPSRVFKPILFTHELIKLKSGTSKNIY